MRHAASLDVVFLMACTGSMTAYLDALKNKVSLDAFVENIHKKIHPSVFLRIAFIGYRDHGNSLPAPRFTSSLAVFEAIVATQSASGSKAEEADVISGLGIVCGLDWVSQTRVLFHIGDSPCHGRQFHGNNTADTFPDGDPHGRRVEDFLQDLRAKNVQYYFGMISTAQKAVGAQVAATDAPLPAPYIVQIQIRPSTMMVVISNVVIKSVSAAVLATGRVDETVPVGEEEEHMELKHASASSKFRTQADFEWFLVCLSVIKAFTRRV